MAVNFTYKSNLSNVVGAIDQRINNSLKQVGLFVEGQAKLLAPVGVYPPKSGRQGGTLRGSISHKVNDKSVVIGTDVPYGVYVEKGTSRQKAQPYLTPAVEQNISDIVRIFEDNFKNL